VPDINLPTASSLDAVPATTKCNFRLQDGRLCAVAAGYGTDHPGVGRCCYHGGGGVLIQESAPGKRRYAVITRERIAHLISHFSAEADSDRWDVSAEVDALRAIFVDFIERYDEYTDALLKWSADYQLTRSPLDPRLVESWAELVETWRADRISESKTGGLEPEDYRAYTQAKDYLGILRVGPDTNKPKQVMDIADAHKILDSIGKMVERVMKFRSANAVSRPELNRVMQEMWRAVDGLVKDEELKKQIVQAWLTIKL